MSGIAEIGIRVFLDNTAAAGLSQLAGQLNQIQGGAGAATTSLRAMQNAAVAGAFVGFGLALMGVGEAVKYSIDAASEFQTAMFGVAVATHVPLDEAMSYSQTLMNLGATSTYTSAEIATGIVQLGRAGYSIQDIFNTLQKGMPSMAEAAINLGIATRSTAEQGFTMLAQAMSAYQAKAVEAGKYSDILQYGFEHQRSSVANFAQGLAQVTPDAARFGIGLDQVVTALDTVGPAMKSSATAGTALRYFIDGLLSPTKAAQGEMVKLGLASVDAGGNFHSAFYNANGVAKSLPDLVGILNGKLHGMSEEARTNALHALFSVRGGQGADVLIQQIGKMMGYLDQLKQSHDNAGGAARRHEEVMRTLAGASAGLSTSIRDLGVAIGMAIIPSVTNFVTGINSMVSGIRSFALANSSALPTILLIAGGVALLGVVITGVMIVLANPVIAVFIGALAAALVVVPLVTLAITRLSQWLNNLASAGGPVGGVVQLLWQEFMRLGSFIASTFNSTLAFLRVQLSSVWPSIVEMGVALRPLLPLLGLLAAVIVGVLLGALRGIIMALGQFISGLAMLIGGIVMVISGIIQYWMGFFTLLRGIFTGNGALIQQGWNQMWQGIGRIVQGILSMIIGIIIGVFGTIIAFIAGFIQGIIAWFQHLANVLVGHSIVPDMMNAIHNVIVSVFTFILGFISNTIATWIARFQMAGAMIQAIIQGAFSMVRSIVTNILLGIVALISGNMAQAEARFRMAGAMIQFIWQNAMNMLRNAVENGINTAMTFFSGLPGRIQGALAGLGAMLFQSGATAMSQFAAGLGSMIGAVVNQVSNAAGQVANFLAHHSPAKMGPLSDDDKWMPNMMTMFASGIKAHTPLVTNAALGMAGNLSTVPNIARQTAANATLGQGGGGGTTVVNLNVDGRTVDKIFMDRLTGQLQSNGLGRAMR